MITTERSAISFSFLFVKLTRTDDLPRMGLHCLPARCSRNVTMLRALPTKVVRYNRTEARTTSQIVMVGAKSTRVGRPDQIYPEQSVPSYMDVEQLAILCNRHRELPNPLAQCYLTVSQLSGDLPRSG